MSKIRLINRLKKENDDEVVFINERDDKRIAFNLDVEKIISMSFIYIEEMFDDKEQAVIMENLEEINMMIYKIFMENLKILINFIADKTKRSEDIVKKLKALEDILEEVVFWMMKDEFGCEVIESLSEQDILGENNV